MRRIIFAVALSGLPGCTTTPPVASLPTVTVTASAETVPVGTSAADAADDPAIWRNPADPAASLIVATDKKAGLYVYGLDGKIRSFEAAGLLNNVDLTTLADGAVLVAASDRNDLTAAKLRLYRLETSTAKLVALGTVTAGAGEAYGVCLWHSGAELHAFSVLKTGAVHQLRLNLAGAAPLAETLRTLKLGTQAEGCVVDPRSATLYVGEEDVGIWRFDARAAGSVEGTLVAPVDGKQLVADVEGLALAPVDQVGGWLIASSQGDNAYALYALPAMTPAGRFRIVPGAYGATEETDGIELALGSFGPDYPEGLFVAQDGAHVPAQNFKLVGWDSVLKALALSPAAPD